MVPPDPMPNSEVKRRSADGSVGSPHVRVGNCQASIKKNPVPEGAGFFALRVLKCPAAVAPDPADRIPPHKSVKLKLAYIQSNPVEL